MTTKQRKQLQQHIAKDFYLLFRDQLINESVLRINRIEALKKLEAFMANPHKQHLLNITEYNLISPRHKGYASYMQASWRESKLNEKNPYKKGTKEYKQFNQGAHVAMMEVAGCG